MSPKGRTENAENRARVRGGNDVAAIMMTAVALHTIPFVIFQFLEVVVHGVSCIVRFAWLTSRILSSMHE